MESGITIYVNEKNDIQNVDIAFGGRIGTTFAKNSEISAIIFHQLNQPIEIGSTDKSVPVDDFKNHFNVKLLFDNVKSIEVVEKALSDAKKNLLINQNI